MMKKFKNVFLLIAVACISVSAAHAADVVLYTASDSPGSAPDGNNGAVDVWTVTGDGGASRSLLKDIQDGNTAMWAIWDLNGGDGTYAKHTFAGGALEVGQSVSIDWAHNVNIESNRSIGIRLMNGDNSEVALVFQGGKQVYTKYDTGSGAYVDIAKWYDRYDIYQLVFTLTGPNTYAMHITEGSIADNPEGWGNDADDGNADVGPIVDQWTGSFTGSAITGIQVYTAGGNDSDQWFDNLSINDSWLAKAHLPSPAYGVEDVAVAGLEMSWAIPQERDLQNPGACVVDPNLVSMNLYINEGEPNFVDVTPISITAWDAQTLTATYLPSPELSKDGAYYWRVDGVHDDAAVITGDVWVFYTELTVPVIIADPVYQVVAADAAASFSVDVESQSPAVYQWYKYVDGISDIMLIDGGTISGATAATLTISGVQPADEGYYYCVVNNDSGVEATSGQAPLAIKARIAYWPFDGGELDSTVVGSPKSIVVGAPTVTSAGIAGDGMVFADNADIIYTDPNLASYFDICDYEMTVACWVKTTDKQQWCALVCRNGESVGWQLRQSGFTDDRPCFTTRGTGNDDGTPANRTIYDNNWHYVVATMDGTIKKVYIDGILSRTYSTDNGSVTLEGDAVSVPVNHSTSPVAIAGRVYGNVVDGLTVEVERNVAGTYDEVEIYNYALDAETIAQTYANVTGSDVCLEQAYDLDGDCVVNLTDLGMLATEWLNSAIVAPAL